MADVSKITVPNGTVYEVKDAYAMRYPYLRSLGSKTYTGVIASANTQQGGGFFYLKVRGTTWNTRWRVKTRVRATVPGQALYDTDTVFEFWSYADVIGGYACENHILNTSYRPIYYNSVFTVSEAGYNNGCGAWIGFSLQYSASPVDASYKRTVIVDVLDYDGCTVELQNALVTPDNIPQRSAHTAWYSSSNTSYYNYDANSQGLKQIGDANSTVINTLNKGSGNFIANSAVYRYQMLFQMDENQLTPLNNVNNSTGTSKAMLTNVEFDPFGGIYFYNSTATVAANAAIGAGNLLYAAAFDLRYTFNCGTTLTANKPFYLVVTPTSGGKCKIASSAPWVQTLPSTKDGKFYILLGRTYSTYQMMLSHEHPVYMHDGTTVREVLPQTALATDTNAGLMSASDKAKLDEIDTGLNIVGFSVDQLLAASGVSIVAKTVNELIAMVE